MSIQDKSPGDLLRVVDNYESLVNELHEYLENKFSDVKLSAVADKLEVSATSYWRKNQGQAWSIDQIKKALKLVQDYEAVKEGIYTYLTKEHLVDLKAKSIAQILQMKERKFIGLKKNHNQWKHQEIRAALELITKWEGL